MGLGPTLVSPPLPQPPANVFAEQKGFEGAALNFESATSAPASPRFVAGSHAHHFSSFLDLVEDFAFISVHSRLSISAGKTEPLSAKIKVVRYVFRRREPAVARILLVESGSRHLTEQLIPRLRGKHGPQVPIDVVTCYAGDPEGAGEVYRVTDYRGGAQRSELYRALAAKRYSIMAMLCTGEPIMTKWKWVLAARLPVKVLVVNENCDSFWLDRGHWSAFRGFVLFRAGLSGAGALRTAARLLLFPFTLAYLLLYASVVHSRRVVRKGDT